MRWAIGAGLFLAACGSGPPRPVEIALNEEACDQCRMAISQRELAAEIVTLDGATYYFDDIGCMARWTAENDPPEDAGWFVTDYDTQGWLDARAAYYVHSARLSTPMNYGLAAFQTRGQAQATANRLDGETVEWTKVLEGGT
jgi:nitrous oxide reductase accessory protein NosL